MYLNADIRLNPELDELPDVHREELEGKIAIRVMELQWNPKPKAKDPNNVTNMYFQRKPHNIEPHDRVEDRTREVAEMRDATQRSAEHAEPSREPPGQLTEWQSTAAQSAPVEPGVIMLCDALQDGPKLDTVIESHPDLIPAFKVGYVEDSLFQKAWI
ncbi:hypothetical protein LXA43DRAFT_1065051 [Ganoderma leucocontextum]|nr:hypothetical protein LXA43DRAFT_1065051 [Ganoderma leucocontextum]